MWWIHCEFFFLKLSETWIEEAIMDHKRCPTYSNPAQKDLTPLAAQVLKFFNYTIEPPILISCALFPLFSFKSFQFCWISNYVFRWLYRGECSIETKRIFNDGSTKIKYNLSYFLEEGRKNSQVQWWNVKCLFLFNNKI